MAPSSTRQGRETPITRKRGYPQPVATSATSRDGSGLVLTRRGRLAAFSSSLLAVVVLVIGAGQMVEAAGAPGESMQQTPVVVQAGDTLWGIAQEIAPDRDPRAVVAQIRSVNDLGTRSIVPGQSIVVPSLG